MSAPLLLAILAGATELPRLAAAVDGEIPPSASLQIEFRAFEDPEACVLLASADVLLLACRVDEPAHGLPLFSALRDALRLRPAPRKKAIGAVLLWGAASAELAASLDHPSITQDSSLSGRALRAVAARLRVALSSVEPPSLLERFASLASVNAPAGTPVPPDPALLVRIKEAEARARQAEAACEDLRRQLTAAERTAEAAIAEQTRSSRQIGQLSAELAALRSRLPQAGEGSPPGLDPAAERLPPDFAEELQSLDSLYDQLTGG